MVEIESVQELEGKISTNGMVFASMIVQAGPQGKEGKQGQPGPQGKDGAVKFEELTEEQRELLKGEKGESFKYSDFTEEQLEKLRGPKGDIPQKGTDYYTEEEKEEFKQGIKEDVTLVEEQIPTGQASGDSIYIEDSGTLDFDWKIKGGHRQETRKGSNLLDFNVAQNSKVTINEDGTITINGQGGFSLAFKQFTAKANTKYYIKWELVSGTVDISKSNGNSFMDPLTGSNIEQGVFKESTVETDKTMSGFWINNMVIFTNARIRFWANTDKSGFEKYGASPSLDYPREIETAGSNINYFKVEPQTQYGITITKNKDGGIVLNGTASQTIRIVNVLNLGASDFTLSISASEVNESIYVRTRSSAGALTRNLKLANTRLATATNKNETYSTELTIDKGAVCNNLIIYPKLEKGNTFTSFSEYNKGSIEIFESNKNLLNLVERDESNGVKTTIDKGILTLNGTITSGWSNLIGIAECRYIKPGNYNFSVDTAQDFDINIRLYNNTMLSSYQDIVLPKNKQNTKVNISSKKYFYYIFISNAEGKTFDNLSFKLQLEKGDIASSIVEHKDNRILMPIQQEILEGDYIADVEHHEWEKIESYNGETITTDYISTTGQLTTGATVYYKLAEPKNLELTETQKAVRAQKLYTYKNITNITISDELASVDVTYKKDLDSEHESIRKEITDLIAKVGDLLIDIDNKVQKVTGKGLSQNDFTNEYKAKLDNINETIPQIVDNLASEESSKALSAKQGKLLNMKMIGTVLYENEQGTTGNITLNDSVVNYDYIEIQCKRGEFIYGSTKLSNVNGKTISLGTNYCTSTQMYVYSKVISISGNVITAIRDKLGYFDSNGVTFTEDDSHYIKEVVGYKVLD